MNIQLTKPQAEFFKSEAKATCAVAGFGSGKTQATVYRMISTMMKYPKADMLYSAPTIPLIRDILWAKLDELLPQIGLKHTTNKAESIVYIQGLGKIFCRSMDSPARLVGFEVVDAFMDELDILPTDKALEVFRKIKARCRQKVYETGRKEKKKWRKKSQQYVSTTPEGFKATYELFKKNPIPNSNLIQMSTYSNPFLPDDYIDDLRASYPPQLIEAYLNGEFVNLVSKPVWDSYDKHLNSVDIPDTHRLVDSGGRISAIVQPGETIHFGADFNVGRGCSVGYVRRTLPLNHPFNPYNGFEPETAEQAEIMRNGWDILVGVGETYNSFDTPDTVRAIEEIFPRKIFPNRFMYPDATGNARKSVNATTSDIHVLKEAGFTIRKRNKNPPIKDRVASGNASFCNGLNQRRVYLDTAVVPNYSDALLQQVYDDNGLPAKGKGEFDDMTDAGTYPLYYHFPLLHNKMKAKTLQGT